MKNRNLPKQRARLQTPFMHKTKSGRLLTPKETRFVEVMVATRGDRIQAISEAYDIDQSKKGWRLTARVMAADSLTKPYISEALNELFAEYELTPELVDRELHYVIEQKAELSSKVKAINEYNKITGRHAPEKHQHEITGIRIENLTE